MEIGKIDLNEVREAAESALNGEDSSLPIKEILEDLATAETLKDLASPDSCFGVAIEPDGVDCKGAPNEDPCKDYDTCLKVYNLLMKHYTSGTEMPEAPEPVVESNSNVVEDTGDTPLIVALREVSGLFDCDIDIKEISPRMTKVYCGEEEIATITHDGNAIRFKRGNELLGHVSDFIENTDYEIKHRQVFVSEEHAPDWSSLLYTYLQIVCNATDSVSEAESSNVELHTEAEESTKVIADTSSDKAIPITELADGEVYSSISDLRALLTALGIHTVLTNSDGEYVLLTEVK